MKFNLSGIYFVLILICLLLLLLLFIFWIYFDTSQKWWWTGTPDLSNSYQPPIIHFGPILPNTRYSFWAQFEPYGLNFWMLKSSVNSATFSIIQKYKIQYKNLKISNCGLIIILLLLLSGEWIKKMSKIWLEDRRFLLVIS